MLKGNRPIFAQILILVLQCSLQGQDLAGTITDDRMGKPSEAYPSLIFNGAWSWFSDPRAAYFERESRKTYAAWIDNFGDIHVGSYDHDARRTDTRTLFNNLGVDDRFSPALIVDPLGRILVFFTKRGEGEGIYFIRSRRPEDITLWEPGRKLELNDPSLLGYGADQYGDIHPVFLSQERYRLYLFYSGIGGLPSLALSDDGGNEWVKGRILCVPEAGETFSEPLVKISSRGSDRIHIALMDNNPGNVAENRIYYMYYQGGSFFRANGEMIRRAGAEPHAAGEMDLVYDGRKAGEKGWIWDISEDGDGHPVLAYSRIPAEGNHLYTCARWGESGWVTSDLADAGGQLPETERTEGAEAFYSGGISMDHENPDVLYLSVKRDSLFEIEQWTRDDLDGHWRIAPVTRGSAKDNVRPVTVRGASEGVPLQVIWMQNTRYDYGTYPPLSSGPGTESFETRFQTALKMNLVSAGYPDLLRPPAIIEILHRVADWQLSNPLPGDQFEKKHLDWLYGAFYTGLMRLYQTLGDVRYADELINVGDRVQWKLLDDIFHADRLTIADVWADLYAERGDPRYIDQARWAMDIHLARDFVNLTDVRFDGNPARFEWWSWCDALYMAPPSFITMSKVTGDPKYLAYADTQWWKTSGHLYSSGDSLFFRDDRFLNETSENGTKIFWSRGNGWVIAGLARLLEDMPEDYVSRGKFERQYLEMAHKLLKLQDEDGLWRVSLIDPEYLDQGESSGSAFFTFALAWGINHGYLGPEHRPAVEKAWKALCGNVNAWGRLGYVQQVAGSPFPFYDHQWQVYASGAFLLAGCEMLDLID